MNPQAHATARDLSIGPEFAREDLPVEVVQVTSGRFHQFDLARQLERRGMLKAIYCGYPQWKLRMEDLPREKVKTFPWLHAPWMAGGARILEPLGLNRHFIPLSLSALDAHVAADLKEAPDALVAMSGHANQCGPLVQRRGGRWLCVRGSTHVRHQMTILRTEFQRWGLEYVPPSPRFVRREEFEYAHADCVVVPSQQARDSFLGQGMAASRLAVASYGVDPGRFRRLSESAAPTDEFRVICVGALSVRKGLGRLLEAFALLRHPRKRLILIGTMTPEGRQLLKKAENVDVHGARPQSELPAWLSQSHVFCLCSVEEGLANVLGQALACGCPIVASAATGAADLFEEGAEGFILPEAEPAAVAEKLELLAQDQALRRRMSEAALRRVETIGGWNRYGDTMERLIRNVVESRGRERAV